MVKSVPVMFTDILIINIDLFAFKKFRTLYSLCKRKKKKVHIKSLTNHSNCSGLPCLLTVPPSETCRIDSGWRQTDTRTDSG